jgi:predicted secreted protein
VKNPKKPTYAQRKELSKLGYDPREYMIIAAPPHEFTLLHIPSQKIIPKVERMK